VVLAHHRVVNDAADSVFTTLTARLGGRPLETGVPGVKSFSARVDSSPRAFLLPKASVLAIVPEASASAVATQLVAAVVPERVRPGELLRVSYRERPRGLLALPVDVGAMRAWVTGSGQTALANVEADCADEAAATAAAEALMPALRHELGQHWMLRIFTNDLLERTTVWADGRTLRVKVDLREDDVRLVARFLCARRGDACEN
jgi:hypothetical protein